MRKDLELAALVRGFAINQDRGIDDSSPDDSQSQVIFETVRRVVVKYCLRGAREVYQSSEGADELV